MEEDSDGEIIHHNVQIIKYSTKEDKAYTISDIYRSYNNVYRETSTLIQTFSPSFMF